MLCWANIFQVTFFNYTERQVPQATNPSVTTTDARTHTHMHSQKQSNLFTLPPSPCHSHTQPHIMCLAAKHLLIHGKSLKHSNTAQVLGERAIYAKSSKETARRHIDYAHKL